MTVRGIYENPKNMAVVTQQTDLVNELFLPAAKLGGDGFRLRLAAAVRITRNGSLSL